MKTSDEILDNYVLNHNELPWYRKTIIKAMEAYHAQFQSQPSISAEEYLKEKGIFDETDRLKHIPMKSEFIKILTEFASRQGKVVEIHNIFCPNCKNIPANNDKYCAGCGSKINWK